MCRSVSRLCCLALLLACVLSRAVANELVIVDLGSIVRTMDYRGSGFQGEVLDASVPSDEMVVPLKIRQVRADVGYISDVIHARVHGFGGKCQAIVSNGWGYPAWGWGSYKHTPYNNWAQWESLVEESYKRGAGKVDEWDIWNEPNGEGMFWSGGIDQFKPTWKHACDKIRALDANAVIVGPSVVEYDEKYLKSFLAWCKANDCVPNKVTWHANSTYATIAANVTDMKTWLTDQGMWGKGAGKVSALEINEWCPQYQQANPGMAVKYLASIESSDAALTSTNHTCWDDGNSVCNDKSLDGILNPTTKAPRASWWAFKGYADITGSLVSVTQGSTVSAVAGIDPDRRAARALLGRAIGGPDIAVDVTFTNIPSCLVRDGRVRVAAHRIDENGNNDLASPLLVISTDCAVFGGQVTITLPSFGPKDAYTIRLLGTI